MISEERRGGGKGKEGRNERREIRRKGSGIKGIKVHITGRIIDRLVQFTAGLGEGMRGRLSGSKARFGFLQFLMIGKRKGSGSDGSGMGLP